MNPLLFLRKRGKGKGERDYDFHRFPLPASRFPHKNTKVFL